jgi:hypothetical protein
VDSALAELKQTSAEKWAEASEKIRKVVLDAENWLKEHTD